MLKFGVASSNMLSCTKGCRRASPCNAKGSLDAVWPPPQAPKWAGAAGVKSVRHADRGLLPESAPTAPLRLGRATPWQRTAGRPAGRRARGCARGPRTAGAAGVEGRGGREKARSKCKSIRMPKTLERRGIQRPRRAKTMHANNWPKRIPRARPACGGRCARKFARWVGGFAGRGDEVGRRGYGWGGRGAGGAPDTRK